MTAERDVAMVAVDAEVVDVGERIVLRLEAIATDLLHELLDVRRNGLEAERAEDLAVEVAHLGANADAAAVVGTTDGPHAVREVPEAVVPVAEQPARCPLGDVARGPLAVFAVERAEHGAAVLHEERQLEQL